MCQTTRSASFDEVRAHTFDRRCNVRASTLRGEATKPRLASKETEEKPEERPEEKPYRPLPVIIKLEFASLFRKKKSED